MQQQASADQPTDDVLSNLAPIPMECDAPFLKIQGELPRELNGTLYRNGPNPQFEAPGAHWLPQPLDPHPEMAGRA
jgi:carotenoid cleavage dioxygenase-like enzyme